MRIITTLLFFLFIALSPILHAQNKLQFKGIPIEGSVKTFISKLQAQGAKLENTEDDLYFFSDSFAGVSNCTIVVSHYKDSIVGLNVYLPKKTSWVDLKIDFVKFEESYTKKYGKPSDSFKFFNYPYYEGNGYEMSAVSMGECHYETFWDVENGWISLEISKSKCIAIQYDYKNGVRFRKQQQENQVNADI